MDEIELAYLGRVVDVEKLDQGAAGDVKARKLIEWFVKGADGQIAWGTPGDFDACVRIAGKHMAPAKAKGFCANRHHDATGQWPGPDAHGGGHKHKADEGAQMGEMAYGWAPITKVEDQPDGTVIVHGPMTSTTLDRDQQRFSQEWLDQAVPQWFAESGNIREQHDPKRAVGNALQVKRDDATGRWDCAAHVVDPVAVAKVKTKVLKGFSIGVKRPQVDFTKAEAPGGEICGGFICENSLVDRPSNPDTIFRIVKSDGDDPEHLEFEPVGELIEKAVTHAPAGSPEGGQFMPGGTDQASGVEANREGAKKVAVSGGGGGGKGGGGGAKKPAKPSAGSLSTTLRAMQALGIKAPDGQSEADSIKAIQAKLGVEVDGKMSPGLRARIRDVIAKQTADKRTATADAKAKTAAAKKVAVAAAAKKTDEETPMGETETETRTADELIAGLSADLATLMEQNERLVATVGDLQTLVEQHDEEMATKADIEGLVTKADVERAVGEAIEKIDKTDATGGGSVDDKIAAAVAEVKSGSEDRFKTIEADLTKALAMPAPGGPVQMRTSGQAHLAQAREGADVRAQIADYQAKADMFRSSDRNLAEGYEERAARLQRTLNG